MPSIVTPYTADQFFWASRVAALGVGPRRVPYHQLTPEGLAGMIRQAIKDQVMRRRAVEIGQQISAEEEVEKLFRKKNKNKHDLDPLYQLRNL